MTDHKHTIKKFYSDFLEKSDLVCYYTKLPLVYNKSLAKMQKDSYIKNPLRATVEHLAPLQRNEHDEEIVKDNLTVASNGINGLLGCAPLKVKLALKEHLLNVVDDASLTLEKRYEVYAVAAVAWMEQYKVDGYYCWDWVSISGNAVLRERLKVRFEEI